MRLVSKPQQPEERPSPSKAPSEASSQGTARRTSSRPSIPNPSPFAPPLPPSLRKKIPGEDEEDDQLPPARPSVSSQRLSNASRVSTIPGRIDNGKPAEGEDKEDVEFDELLQRFNKLRDT
mmetsp:Transcript_12001/g.10278  ORF Transcript_12001/g.10278 Transcript_12001/m.10278 type:complete len:121 (-) Transcript_12001:46-408(-)